MTCDALTTVSCAGKVDSAPLILEHVKFGSWSVRCRPLQPVRRHNQIERYCPTNSGCRTAEIENRLAGWQRCGLITLSRRASSDNRDQTRWFDSAFSSSPSWQQIHLQQMHNNAACTNCYCRRGSVISSTPMLDGVVDE